MTTLGVLSTSVWHSESARSSLEGALTAMIGIECLLLVALAVVAASSAREAPLVPRGFAVVVAAAVSLVAIGAAAAWYRKFLPDFPDHETDAIESIGLLVGVLAPMLLSWWLAMGLRGR